MDSSQNLNIEPNQTLEANNPISNANIEEHYQNLNIPFQNGNNAQVATTFHEVRQIIKKENDAGGINKIENIEYQLNSVPFKSLIQDKNQTYSSSPLNELNNNVHHIENNTNPFANNNEAHYMSNKKNENRNENRYRSQNSEKIVNMFPSGTFKIELFKSRPKSRKTINNFNNFMNKDSNVLSLNNVIKEENDHYKLLIKKIASQLKKRRNPPTKGIFYTTIIKTEIYLKRVKNIGNRMKIRVRQPTHGFFFKIIKNEQYKLLVKKIASQLKKRRRLPSCKIIKIYEPYRLLIKKISEHLKKSRNKRMMEASKNNNLNINHGNNIINNDYEMNEGKMIIDEEHKTERIITDSNAFQGNNSINNIENNMIINNNVDIISNNACKIIREGKEVKSYPNLSKQGKNINIEVPFIKKDNSVRLSENKRKRNSSFIEVNDNKNSEIDNEELNTSRDLNISLSNIEVTKTNFIHDFDRFLNKTKIKIINNFPVSLEEKNKFYFKQSNFWFLVLNYLFYQSDCISLFTIISILEQYFIWCTDKSLDNFNSIKETIKEYINNHYTPEMICQFLFMNQLNSIDQIFQKYEIGIKKNENNFKEIKLNIEYNQGNCQCELCTNNEACIKKVADDNKNKIKVINNECINYIGPQNGEKKSEKNNDISNSEELFFKGKSKKKQNVFSKSKIVQSESTNLEYNINTSIISNHEEIIENNGEKNYRNISKKKERKREEKNNNESDKEKEKEENDEEDKNKKKGKKRKKTKSKNKNKDKEKDKEKNNNKGKKRDSSNSDKNEEEEEKEEAKTKIRSKSKSRSKSKKKKKDKKSNKNSDEIDSDEKEQKDEIDD